MVNYKSASFTMAGAACLVSLVSYIFWLLGSGGCELVPGLMYAERLAVPVLFAWLGILLRKWIHQSQLWITIPLAIIAGIMLFNSASYPDFYTFTNRGRVCLAMLIMGYLIPEGVLKSFGEKERRFPSVLIFLAAALCYTCIEVIETRIPYIGPSVEDMPLPQSQAEAMVRSLLQIAETAALCVSVYSATAVSFSSIGVAIGNSRWIRRILYLVFILHFFKTLHFVSPNMWLVRGYGFLCLVSSPVFVYMMSVTRKSIRKLGQEKEITWKEVLSI